MFNRQLIRITLSFIRWMTIMWHDERYILNQDTSSIIIFIMAVLITMLDDMLRKLAWAKSLYLLTTPKRYEWYCLSFAWASFCLARFFTNYAPVFQLYAWTYYLKNCLNQHKHSLFGTCPTFASQEYEDGEILVESEPIRYELRDIKKDKWRTSITPNETILGTTVLTNTGEGSNTVETVISYKFNRVIYWGTVEGVGRGLPTQVYENAKSSPVELKEGWGLKVSELVTEVRAFNLKSIQLENGFIHLQYKALFSRCNIQLISCVCFLFLFSHFVCANCAVSTFFGTRMLTNAYRLSKWALVCSRAQLWMLH